jgi:NADPH-dependent 2,4-dienoyl-CoA reductase/sulfur reductase-like enzyme
MRLVIVGGSDAGISAGLRARELDPAVEVMLLLADRFPNYSICGLPFYISGETADWRDLAHQKLPDLESAGLELLMEHQVTSIQPEAKLVHATGPESRPVSLHYDKLIIATGAELVRPPIPGLDLEGVHLLHTMEDSFRVQAAGAALGGGRALVIGGGYIGLEMADSLTHRGLRVTVVEQLPAVMPTVDAELGNLVAEELGRHAVTVRTGVAVERIERIERNAGRLVATGSGGFEGEFDLVLVAVGVRPSADLAVAAGIEIGTRGAIRVNRCMETTVADVYGAGDCVETWHRLLQRPLYLPLGTTAHKQGRVAGERAVGGQAEFQGSLGTQVVKVFDLAVARTGLRQDEALHEGFQPVTTETRVWDHKAYYPGAHELTIRVTGDRRSGRLLGAQMIGHPAGQVAKRIDIFATALFHAMTVDGLSDLDLSYTPPFSAPWDPVQVAAQEWAREVPRAPAG